MPKEYLLKRLQERKQQNALRQTVLPGGGADFCSNDYLGIATKRLIDHDRGNHFTGSGKQQPLKSGSTGSRLLAGNYALIEAVEREVAAFHNAPAGLIFNSGYDANLGLLSCVTEQGDTILYDQLSHASLRDGIRLSRAQSASFKHNDMADLSAKLEAATGSVFVVTESVFSMHGDMAPLAEILALCDRYDADCIVDEAHATGVVGTRGEGVVQSLGLENRCFARIHTFGKACGVHGAIILGNHVLREYLVNFCRPFIYTTALPESSVAAIRASYSLFPTLGKEREHLHELITAFKQSGLTNGQVATATPIQAVVIPGNDEVKRAAQWLQDNDLDVRPILYPSVPKGEERLRIVFHAFNTMEEVARLISCLQKERSCH